jgi:histidinol dehydrogenase
MPIRLDAKSPDFAQRFRAFLDTKREASADVEATVRTIIADVVARGDAALVELTNKFDRVSVDAKDLRVTAADLDAAHAATASPTHSASSSVTAGPRSRRSGSTCRAARPPILPPC